MVKKRVNKKVVNSINVTLNARSSGTKPILAAKVSCTHWSISQPAFKIWIKPLLLLQGPPLRNNFPL